MQQSLAVFEKLPQFIHKGILALAILFITWIIALLLCSLLKRLTKHKQTHIVNTLTKLVRNIIIIIGLVCALGTMGINITALVASLGLASFAAGYALKDMLGNSIAGFMIMFNETVKVGDKINIGSCEGEVESINLRYTVLIADDKHFYIPNGTFNTSTLTIYQTGA